MKYLFLDTNILLHYQSFENIPWNKVLGIAEDFTIVICETVIAEVDKHKDSARSKLRDRAKKVSSRISELLLDGVACKVPVSFCPFVKPTAEEESRYEMSVCDNRIILAALHSGYDLKDIVVVSADNNLLIKGKSAGLGFHKMKEEFLVKGEPTEEEKELKKTKEELARWTSRMSDPKVIFADSEEDTLTFTVPNLNDVEAEVEKRVQAEALRLPEKQMQEPQDAFAGDYNELYRQLASLGSNILNQHNAAEIATYNAMRKEYLEAYREKTRLEVRKEYATIAFKKVRLCICNTGTAQTGDMFITVKFEEGIKLYTADDSKTTQDYPELITPQYDRQWANINQGLLGLNGGYVPNHSVTFMDESKPIRKHSFTYQEKDLIHNLQSPLETDLLIDTRQAQEFKIKWSIADASLIEPKYGILNVKVMKSEA